MAEDRNRGRQKTDTVRDMVAFSDTPLDKKHKKGKEAPLLPLDTSSDEVPPPVEELLGDTPEDEFGERTLIHGDEPQEGGPQVRRFRLTMVEGANVGAVWESAGDSCSIGSHRLNDLVIEDATVSRFHCEVRVDAAGARVADLNSRNGTILDGVRVKDAYLRGGSLLRLGRAVVNFQFAAESNRLPVSGKTRFGSMVGSSVTMRAAFSLLERAAATDATVLIEGETGTGKGAAAESIHKASARKDKPFLVIDCSAISANLLESELFGHEKGSFTSADTRRIGAFEEANGGTIFLDEIGELPADLQPKLLRVLENKEIRRVGSNQHKTVNVRVIAATNRDLRSEVNAGRFRSDLYFRLAVLKVPLPSLRARPEDIPTLADQILRSMRADAAQIAALSAPKFLGDLQRAAWPGNVRELRNYLERCLVFQDALPMSEGGQEVHAGGPAHAHGHGAAQAAHGVAIDPRIPYADARKTAIDEFERAYLAALLAAHQGKVAQAATASGMDRVYLYRLLRKHGLSRGEK